MHPEALLAAAYAVLLFGVAVGLDLLARHSHRRSERYRTAGFRYRPHVDAWECSEGEHLKPREVDHERRVVRYRGRAEVCNACGVKEACTDSDEGREIVRALDSWPRSDVGRFHRGISLALVLLAAVVLAVVLLRRHEPAEVLLLTALLATACALGLRLLSEFQAQPSNFPGGRSA